MSGLKASKQQQSNFKRPDPLDTGSYPGRVVRVYDLGLQPQRTFPGNPPKGPAHEIHVNVRRRYCRCRPAPPGISGRAG